MPAWLENNLATIIISAILLTVIGLIVGFKIKNKKNGKRSCGCGCKSCAMSDVCHKDK